MNEKDRNRISIKLLLRLFSKLKAKRPDLNETDYSRWNQTEEEYQEEQANWLESVRRKKKNQNKK